MARGTKLLRLALLGSLVVVAAAIGAALFGPGADPVASGLGPPRFVEEAAAAGIEHVYDGEFEFFVGGGVAVLDCDGDGRPDLYFAGGSEPAALYRNRSRVGGALRFELLPDPVTDLSRVTGAYPLDIDADRYVDLAVLRYGENVVLRGLGGCRFERANERLGFDGGDAWTTAFSATWEGGAALPTLAIGNYVKEPLVDPDRLCFDNELVRPESLSGSYGQAVKLMPGWCALSMLFSDWDRSGRRDLRISNDRHYYHDYSDGEEELWRIEPGGEPHRYGHDEGWETVRINGMGIASADLTGDGMPEIFLTSQGDNKLQTLAGGPARPSYRNIALERGVTAHRPFAGGDALPSTAWHAEFDDLNNDGLIDLFVAKGNVEAMPDYASKDPSNLLLGQPDGTFVEAAEAAGVLSFARARGAALSDLNLDGLLDLVVVNRREAVKVWRNVGAGDAGSPAAMGDWLAVRLEDAGPNHDGIGAWIEVRVGGRTMTREVTVGGGHAGGELGPTHFGLGEADRAEVRVQWPDGETGPWLEVAANQFVTIGRGALEAVRWAPWE